MLNHEALSTLCLILNIWDIVLMRVWSPEG
jgi:hypothetical protein